MENFKNGNVDSLQINKSDVMQALIAIFTGFAIIFPLFISSSHQPNAFLQKSIPPAVGLIFVLFPIWMLYVVDKGERLKQYQILQAKRRFQVKKSRRRLFLRVDHRNCPGGGSKWDIANRNCFDWNNVHIVITKHEGGAETKQLHRFGRIGKGQKISFLSEFETAKDGFFEYYLVCEEGKHRDFPTINKGFDPEILNQIFVKQNKIG